MSWRVSGGAGGCPRTGEADAPKYNYGEIVSRLNEDYPTTSSNSFADEGIAENMNILVLGSGGREHAILWALKRTATSGINLYCAPGNGGISDIAECVPIPVSDHQALIKYAQSNRINLTVVGPEAPLAAGIVDEFEEAGLKIVGPCSAAARLESSKAFAKDFMHRHGIPTADSVTVSSAEQALETIRHGRFGAADSRVVIKADGLAAGKGVIVAGSRREAEAAIAEITSGALVSSEAAQHLIIEEALAGTEVSVLLFSDGHNYALMPAARDHKRIGENDTGPNTGGMGAITDSSVLDEETLQQIVRDVVEPTLKGAAADGFPFRGILFVGLMLTAAGPKVLEYNVRFGDPETQAILVRLKSDLSRIFQAMVDGTLDALDVEWTDQSSACVVLASAGYPGAYETGVQINGLPQVPPGVQVFHSGTSKDNRGGCLTAGGRVLGITAAADTLNDVLRLCYAATDRISWKGMQYRRDIGRFHNSESRVSGS
ncbi:MAG TPA: phosphoribosylamine--glycine ligase [Pyrinomonadaceae bacterium]|nr:phosphoribosylamine--glycine ligase [Pyrinomonadaceae bacterium]